MTSVTKCLDPDTGLTNCLQRLSPSDESQLAGTFMYEPSVILLPAHPASFAHNFVSGMQSFYFSQSQDAMLLQMSLKIVFWTCSWDSLMWETASPRTHKPKIVNESL